MSDPAGSFPFRSPGGTPPAHSRGSSREHSLANLLAASRNNGTPSRTPSSRTPSTATPAAGRSRPARYDSLSTSRSSSGGIEMRPAPARGSESRSSTTSAPSAPRRPRLSLSGDAGDSVDLTLLDYVDDVDPHLICPICQAPFLEPTQLSCDHTFCRACVGRSLEVLSSSSTVRGCPSCRAPVDMRTLDRRRQPPRFVVQMLDALRVYCPNRLSGCKDTVARGDVKTHVARYCSFTIVPCPDQDCLERVCRGDIKDNKCLHKTAACEDCGERVMTLDMESHLRDRCANRYTECVHCDAMLPKREMDAHVADTCDLAVVSCPGSEYGCPYADRRVEMAEHKKTCPIALMTPRLRADAEKIAAAEAKVKAYERKITFLEGSLSSLQATVESSRPGSSGNATPAQSPMPSPELASQIQQQQQASDSQLIFDIRADQTRLDSAIADLDSRLSMAVLGESLRTKESLAHANAAINALRVQVHYLVSANRASGPAMSLHQRPTPAPPRGPMSMRTRSYADFGRNDVKL